jgi:CRP/FNR family transcriptional regulator
VHPELEQALAVSFWSKLPRAPVEALLAEGARAEATEGQIVTAAEGKGTVAIVLSGLFRMFAHAKSGRQVTTRYARQGDMLGLISALAQPWHLGRLQALSAGAAWVISNESLRRHALGDARIALALAEEMARTNYDMLEEFANTAFGTVRQRVARHLLDLVGEAPDGGGSLLAPISQQELANAVGTVREVVSRVLQAFRGEGLACVTQAGIEVLDATRLYEQSRITE